MVHNRVKTLCYKFGSPRKGTSYLVQEVSNLCLPGQVNLARWERFQLYSFVAILSFLVSTTSAQSLTTSSSRISSQTTTTSPSTVSSQTSSMTLSQSATATSSQTSLTFSSTITVSPLPSQMFTQQQTSNVTISLNQVGTLNVQLPTKLTTPGDACSQPLTSDQQASLTSSLVSLCGLQLYQQLITNVAIQPLSSSDTVNCVLRFTIHPGSPRTVQQTLAQFESVFAPNVNIQLVLPPTEYLVLLPPVFSWNPNGPCPGDSCQNGGQCVSSTTNQLSCSCTLGYAGSTCNLNVTGSINNAPGTTTQPLLALIALLVIPIIAILIVVIYFAVKAQQKKEKEIAQREHEAAQVREQGARNMVYPTIDRSYALAFNGSVYNLDEPEDKMQNTSSPV